MFAIIPVVGTLMFLGVPASNGALSIYLAPDAFRTLHDVLPMPAAVETIRSILYFGGDTVAEHLQVLALWGMVSLLLVVVIDSMKRVRTEPDFGDLDLDPPVRPTPTSGARHARDPFDGNRVEAATASDATSDAASDGTADDAAERELVGVS